MARQGGPGVGLVDILLAELHGPEAVSELLEMETMARRVFCTHEGKDLYETTWAVQALERTMGGRDVQRVELSADSEGGLAMNADQAEALAAALQDAAREVRKGA